jgi:hypothetical protein
MSKLDRRNQARQKQQLKHQEKAQANSIFTGANAAPRHIAVVPLSVDIDVAGILRSLNESVDVSADVSADTISRVRIDRFRQSLQYIPAKYDLMGALDVCRMADFVVLALSSEVEVEEQGEQLLRAIEGQGISNVVAVVQVCRDPSFLDHRVSTTNRGIIFLGTRQDQSCQETSTGGLFSQIIHQPLLPFCRKGPVDRLETGMFQRCPVPVYRNTEGYPLAR